MASEGGSRRFFKVWSGDRRHRKAVMASSLANFLEVACAKLGYSHQAHRSELRVALECDGTDVEDETAFAFLPAGSVLLLLLPGEQWLPPSVEAIKTGKSESDHMAQEVDAVDAATEPDSAEGQELLCALLRDFTKIQFLTESQLQKVCELQDKLPQGVSHEHARWVIELCDRKLVEKRDYEEARAAIALLRRTLPIADEHDGVRLVDASTQTQRAQQTERLEDLRSDTGQTTTPPLNQPKTKRSRRLGY